MSVLDVRYFLIDEEKNEQVWSEYYKHEAVATARFFLQSGRKIKILDEVEFKEWRESLSPLGDKGV